MSRPFLSSNTLTKALYPIAAFALCLWVFGSIMVNTVVYGLTHQQADRIISLYQRSDQIIAERLSSDRPCDSECKSILHTIKTAFQHPDWYATYQNYQALPPPYVQLLTPLPLSIPYMADTMKVAAVFSMEPLKADSLSGQPEYNQEWYQSKLNSVTHTTHAATSALIQACTFTALVWLIVAGLQWMLLTKKQQLPTEVACQTALWHATQQGALFLLLMTGGTLMWLMLQ